ncbi:hypothetical protein [Chroococcidiopsis sp. SAG 2025]|uniref:hypothetical protein n=1 Tax=Chroococcidiopsis sp. SAG 2025 TaxID=171389 RepID=UPI002937498A|nr:hypothetical protein [Chroococcidiopsis sp. SAG 2025]
MPEKHFLLKSGEPQSWDEYRPKTKTGLDYHNYVHQTGRHRAWTRVGECWATALTLAKSMKTVVFNKPPTLLFGRSQIQAIQSVKTLLPCCSCLTTPKIK